jgi:DNA polymerase IV (DinB-like DNA polymerase)
MIRQDQKVIFLVDFDAFYVSVETRENPALKGMPLVVGADPEEGRGRGVVVSCSYEARKFGLRSGMPISKAYRLCPTATYLRPNFELYERVSEELMNLLRDYADQFEQVSIDEAFLDVTSKAKTIDQAKSLAYTLKGDVKTLTGLTCSIGVGPNKSTAKIASDMQKPDGLTVLPFDNVEGFLAPLPVSVIPGVGKKTTEFLQERKIEKVGELQKVEGKQLTRWFGKSGVWLWAVIHGHENTPVKETEMPKSLSVERTFREDTADYNLVVKEAAEASSELIERVRGVRLEFKVAGIKIRFSGFETHTREKKLTSHTDSETALAEAVRFLLEEFQSTDRPVRLVGVRVAELRRKQTEAAELDSWLK